MDGLQFLFWCASQIQTFDKRRLHSPIWISGRQDCGKLERENERSFLLAVLEYITLVRKQNEQKGWQGQRATQRKAKIACSRADTRGVVWDMRNDMQVHL